MTHSRSSLQKLIVCTKNLAWVNIFRNLARAVQYVTLLRGESGRVARDWLQEARLTLEARQVFKLSIILTCLFADGAYSRPQKHWWLMQRLKALLLFPLPSSKSLPHLKAQLCCELLPLLLLESCCQLYVFVAEKTFTQAMETGGSQEVSSTPATFWVTWSI